MTTFQTYKIMTLGANGVGKTALIIQLISHIFEDVYNPTIHDTYRRHIFVNNQRLLVEISDVNGQEDFFTVQKPLIELSDGFLLIYSITSRSSFNELEKYLIYLFSIKETSVCPLLIIGNKSDLSDYRAVASNEGYLLAQRYNTEYVEISAKTLSDIESVCDQLLKKIMCLNSSIDTFKKPQKHISCME